MCVSRGPWLWRNEQRWSPGPELHKLSLFLMLGQEVTPVLATLLGAAVRRPLSRVRQAQSNICSGNGGNFFQNCGPNNKAEGRWCAVWEVCSVYDGEPELTSEEVV